MRGYLIDTNVISEYNREQSPHPGVVKWLDTTPEASQYVSVLTLAEIRAWIDSLTEFSDQIPAMPGETFPREMIYIRPRLACGASVARRPVAGIDNRP